MTYTKRVIGHVLCVMCKDGRYLLMFHWLSIVSGKVVIRNSIHVIMSHSFCSTKHVVEVIDLWMIYARVFLMWLGLLNLKHLPSLFFFIFMSSFFQPKSYVLYYSICFTWDFYNFIQTKVNVDMY